MLLFDPQRASTFMADQGIDVLLAHTPHSAGYLADYWPHWIKTDHYVGEDGGSYQQFVGLPADRGREPFVTCRTGADEADMFYNQVWVKDKRMWGPTNPGRAAVSPWGAHAKVYADPLEAAVTALRDRGLAESRVALEMRYLGLEPFERLKRLLPGATFVDAIPVLYQLRSTKSEEEMRRMRVVAAATERAIHTAFDSIREGTTGFDLERALARAHADEGVRHEWTHVCVGPRGAIMQNPTEDEVKRGAVIRIDAGATFKGYNSDISRVAVFGEPSPDLERFHGAAREALEKVSQAIKPGVRGSSLHKLASETVAKVGQALFCAAGHGLGRDVHEAPYLSATTDCALEPGMALTIEIVLMIREMGAIALEDEVAVTEEGCMALSTTGRELHVIPG